MDAWNIVSRTYGERIKREQHRFWFSYHLFLFLFLCSSISREISRPVRYSRFKSWRQYRRKNPNMWIYLVTKEKNEWPLNYPVGINMFNDEMNIWFLGRNSCECQASKHKLIGNCMKCGRIVCEQEGSGPCFFCGNLVKTILCDNHQNMRIWFRFVLEKNDWRLFPVRKKDEN